MSARRKITSEDIEAMTEARAAAHINDLIQIIETLIAAASHMPIFGAEASVLNVRKAGKYIQAVEDAERIVTNIRESLV